VLDCSIVLAWYFADEANAYADRVARALPTARAVVPAHWSLEVANTIVMGERRNRSTEAQALAFVAHLSSLPIDVDDQTGKNAWSLACTLARTHGLSAYDAAYLELAARRQLPIATLDKSLEAAAKTVGIALYQPK
jgi:predicted nucleic acid-binding protein